MTTQKCIFNHDILLWWANARRPGPGRRRPEPELILSAVTARRAFRRLSERRPARATRGVTGIQVTDVEWPLSGESGYISLPSNAIVTN